jgi:hypothetical protein
MRGTLHVCVLVLHFWGVKASDWSVLGRSCIASVEFAYVCIMKGALFASVKCLYTTLAVPVLGLDVSCRGNISREADSS